MSPEAAINEREALKSQLRFLRVMVAALFAMAFGLLALAAYGLLHETTFVVPPEVRRPYAIGADYASRDYLLDMASYVLDKVGTVTPETVDFNNRVLLRMAHPDGYPVLKTALDAAALRLKKERITTLWIPRNESVNEAAKSVQVSGQMKTFIADRLTSQIDKTFLVEFTITVAGRLYVAKIEEVSKPDAVAGKPAARS